jgi:poly(3-hydroxybutyrate) depolymerase
MGKIAVTILIAAFGSALHAQTVNLHGKVTNSAGQPVVGAVVQLMHQGLKMTTGADGAYTLTGTVALAQKAPSAQGVSLEQGVLQIAVSHAAGMKVEVFDLKGNLLRMEAVPNASPGLYRWDFGMHALSDQMMIIKASVGRETRTFRYMPMGDGEAAGGIPASGFTPAAAFLAKTAADLDMLQVTATGYVTKQVSVSAWDATLDVTLSAASAGGRSAGCGKTSTLKTGKALTFTPPGGGGARTYNLMVPADYDNNTAYRLIVSIHWLNGTANNVTDGGNGSATIKPYYGLAELANPAGGKSTTIFVAPQGQGNSWPSGQVPFITSLVDMLKNELCIDNTRIFAEGFSMGGSMSYALACEAPDMFRAVAVHSGGPMSGCNKKNKPVPYFMTHGTQDQTCTFPGYGVPQINEFAKLDGCEAMDIPGTLKPTDASGMNPACADFKGCTEGYPARACIFVGPHTPSPGGSKTWVPAETWKFISQF